MKSAKSKKTVVVDANVALEAAEKSGCALECRNTLVSINDGGHQVAFCDQLAYEWLNHAGPFATSWLTAMRSGGRVKQWDLEQEIRQLRARFTTASLKRRGIEDIHLLATSFKASKIVFSKDSRARKLFAQYAPKDIQTVIHWSNPCLQEEQTIDWITRNFPAREDLLLSNYSE